MPPARRVEGDMAMDPATPLREIAFALPGAMAVLDHLGLDYCCSGNTTLAAACDAAGMPLDAAMRQLEDASRSAANVASFHNWRADRPAVVAAHLVDHNYAVERESMADTTALLAKAAVVHGVEHPELRRIEPLWTELCKRLTKHLHDEGPVVTPIAESAVAASAAGGRAFVSQHEEVVALAHQIRTLTNGYAVPTDGCDAIEALYRDLAAFEADLHEHVLLADNVLFLDPSQRA